MAVIKCPHCGKIISSNVNFCTECGKPLPELLADDNNSLATTHPDDVIEGLEDEEDNPRDTKVDNDNSKYNIEQLGRGSESRKWYHLSVRRVIILCFIMPFLALFAYLIITDFIRSNELEDRAYQRLENSTDLLVFEDFIVRFPDSKYIEDVKSRYKNMKIEHSMFYQEAAHGGREELLAFIQAHPTSPYRAVCERCIDTLDWNQAQDINTLEGYQSYLAKHPEGIFVADATDARNRQLRLIVTPEETSILRGALDNFLAAMTANDANRIDELTRGSINFCGISDAKGVNVVEYYQQNIHKDDVLGVHFQLGGTSINKRNVPGSDALSYNLYSNATATINRSSLDSAMVVNYRVSANFSPERRLTSVTVTPVVETPQPAE